MSRAVSFSAGGALALYGAAMLPGDRGLHWIVPLLFLCGGIFLLALPFARAGVLRRKPWSPMRLSGASSLAVLHVRDGALVGEVDGFGVEARRQADGRVIVRVSGVVDELSLRAESRLTLVTRPTEDLRTGDPPFDDAVILAGEPVAVRAALDATARACIRGALARVPALRIEAGGIAVELPGPPASRWALDDVVRPLLDVARALPRRGADPRDGLEHIVRTDALPEPRKNALEALLAAPGDFERIRPVLEHALQDRSPEVRVVAATALGNVGALEALVDGDAPDEVRIRAFGRMLALLESGPRRERLARAFRDASSALAAAALSAARSLGEAEHAFALGSLSVVGVNSPREVVSAARSVILAATESAESSLLALLTHPHEVLRLAAIEALGDVGSRDAIAPLLSRPASTGERRAAEVAIRSIQGRLGGARGGVSLAESGPAGALSPAVETGALSEADLRARAKTQKT